MKRDFVEWLQEGVLDGIITLDTAQKIYTVLYDDFIGGDFSSFIFGM